MIPTLQLGQTGRNSTLAAFAGVLDPYLTGIWAACGLARLVGSYSGPAIRVRRNFDSVELDIYLSGTVLNTGALATFIGADSAFVSVWYDQSGQGNHFANATAADQPRIVNAGVYDGKLMFNLSTATVNLQSVNSGGTGTAKSIFRKMVFRSTPAAANFDFEYDDGIDGTGGTTLLGYNSYVQTFAYIMAASGPGQSICYYNTTPITPAVWSMVFKRGLTPGNAGISVYKNAALQTPGTVYEVSGGCGGGNYLSHKWRLGGGAASAGSAIDVYSMVIYDADKNANALAINAALA